MSWLLFDPASLHELALVEFRVEAVCLRSTSWIEPACKHHSRNALTSKDPRISSPRAMVGSIIRCIFYYLLRATNSIPGASLNTLSGIFGGMIYSLGFPPALRISESAVINKFLPLRVEFALILGAIICTLKGLSKYSDLSTFVQSSRLTLSQGLKVDSMEYCL